MVGYVTVVEADAYVTAHYTFTSAEYKRWDSLADEDKSIYLLKSVEAIDMLPFLSYKTSLTQTYAFPRGVATVVPNNVKYAQIENALKLSEELDMSEYERMELLGITSYSIGNLKENLKGGMMRTNIVSVYAMQLLKPYMSGGYSFL